ncbi:hypothetical protein MIMGU_mgv1a018644mg [Erythranthe guttata]|uniref:Protein BIG GRAIN 1-like E n=1 Tax=Erythranthe guttata TaxID=4155 RepID=A0A022RPX0_ERYGU|nr:hypothetical protein MIMGU_mgv1a018644mg [Erythranthe guttata]
MLSSNPNKNSLQWRKNSGELDVFEAAKYFSAANENEQNSDNVLSGTNLSQAIIVREDRQNILRRSRLSLDLMPNDNPISHQKMIVKERHQPTSPGGKLASFLNSLFNQRHYSKTTKKKNNKSKPEKDFDDENTPGGGRRKRRSSISHFIRITSSNNNNNHTTYPNTPAKQVIISLPKNTGNSNLNPASMDYECVKEKSRNGSFGFSSNKDDYEGAESDSSSDLFDLPNHELDFGSSDLPVYETTRVNIIRIAKPISRATTTTTAV